MRHAILVIEDDRAAREGLVELLDAHGFVAIPATGGREALEYLRAGGGASVIILDAVMPDMDGWAFRRAQRADPKLADTPVVVVSALDGRPIKGLKPDAALVKPIDVKRLLRIVQELCASSVSGDVMPS